MRHAYVRIATLIVIASLSAACAAGRAFSRGDDAARAGDWETAVDHYRRAVDKDPNNAEYRIAYERAMISASQVHLDAEQGTLWTTCQDNGLLSLKFTHNAWPFAETTTPPGMQTN